MLTLVRKRLISVFHPGESDIRNGICVKPSLGDFLPLAAATRRQRSPPLPLFLQFDETSPYFLSLLRKIIRDYARAVAGVSRLMYMRDATTEKPLALLPPYVMNLHLAPSPSAQQNHARISAGVSSWPSAITDI